MTKRLSDVDRQLCAIRARLECARQGYAVHVGCGGECTEDSPGGYAYTCQACGATVDWRSPDISVPPAHDHYERDVAWLLSRLSETPEPGELQLIAEMEAQVRHWQASHRLLAERGAPYTEADELVVTWYSQGPDGEFELHASADDARAAAESMLEYYSANAASDGEWNTDIDRLQWGKLVPHEVASVHEIPAPEGFPDGEYWDVTLSRTYLGDPEPRG